MLIVSAPLAACSTTFTPQPCSIDTDCGDGSVCELRDQQPVCVRAEDAPLIIGQSAPVTGNNQALGTGMKLGIELAFAEKNAAGGIRGRQLQLDFRDDAYVPDLAEAAARALADVQVESNPAKCPSSTAMIAGNPPVTAQALDRGPNAVLAFLGNVGTPTMVRTAPVAVESGTIFFGPFTGANTVLRDNTAGDCKRYIFNVRASYGQEAEATVEYFKYKGVGDYKAMISFDQSDSFGQAGYDGLVAAYKTNYGSFPGSADPVNPIARFRYVRGDDTSVPAQATAATSYLANLLGNQSGMIIVGVMMTDTYGAGAQFIEALRTWQMASDSQQTSLNKATRLKLNFSNVSFVGPNTLSDRLVMAGNVAMPSGGTMPMTQDVIVSQVVPNYQSDTSDVVVAYNRLIAANQATPGFTSLEGYVAARVFIAGLDNHQGPFTPESLIQSFENLPDLSLGIGAASGFSASSHQYSGSVWGTAINSDGSFKNLYFWTDGSQIQIFE
jgi:ABC-type branched-subunit amino acid transport system substrate-binding protein